MSQYVARSLKIIDESGLAYRMGPMGTTLEGEWGDVMGVIKKCYDEMRKDCPRIECSIKIDARESETGRLDTKIKSVEEKVGKKLNA